MIANRMDHSSVRPTLLGHRRSSDVDKLKLGGPRDCISASEVLTAVISSTSKPVSMSTISTHLSLGTASTSLTTSCASTPTESSRQDTPWDVHQIDAKGDAVDYGHNPDMPMMASSVRTSRCDLQLHPWKGTKSGIPPRLTPIYHGVEIAKRNSDGIEFGTNIYTPMLGSSWRTRGNSQSGKRNGVRSVMTAPSNAQAEAVSDSTKFEFARHTSDGIDCDSWPSTPRSGSPLVKCAASHFDRRHSTGTLIPMTVTNVSRSSSVEAVSDATSHGVNACRRGSLPNLTHPPNSSSFGLRATVGSGGRMKTQTSIYQSLKDAIATKDLASLRQAIILARNAGISTKDVEDIESLLTTLEAEEMLYLTASREKIGPLRRAIRHASSVGVAATTIHTAEHLLARLEVNNAIMKALPSKNIDQLQTALGMADQKGIWFQECEQAQKEVMRLRANDVATIAGQTSHQKDPNVEEVITNLKRAISLRETGYLRSTLRDAKKLKTEIPEVDTEVEVAKRLLTEIETELQLCAALRSRDRAKLQEAIRTAQNNGIQNAKVKEARTMFDKIDARDELSSAITGKSPQLLRERIARARALGVEDSKIEKGLNALRRLEYSGSITKQK